MKFKLLSFLIIIVGWSCEKTHSEKTKEIKKENSFFTSCPQDNPNLFYSKKDTVFREVLYLYNEPDVNNSVKDIVQIIVNSPMFDYVYIIRIENGTCKTLHCKRISRLAYNGPVNLFYDNIVGGSDIEYQYYRKKITDVEYNMWVNYTKEVINEVPGSSADIVIRSVFNKNFTENYISEKQLKKTSNFISFLEHFIKEIEKKYQM